MHYCYQIRADLLRPDLIKEVICAVKSLSDLNKIFKHPQNNSGLVHL